MSWQDSILTADELFLELDLARALHVYVLNEDAAGRTVLLFPCRELPVDGRLARGAGHRLPWVSSVRDAFWPVFEATERERLWVLAAERPLPALESVLGAASGGCAESVDGSERDALAALLDPAPIRREIDRGLAAGWPVRRVSVAAEAGRSSVWVTMIELRGESAG